MTSSRSRPFPALGRILDHHRADIVAGAPREGAFDEPVGCGSGGSFAQYLGDFTIGDGAAQPVRAQQHDIARFDGIVPFFEDQVLGSSHEVGDDISERMRGSGFRRDFAAIAERVRTLQPWFDEAHKRIMAAELNINRLYIPF